MIEILILIVSFALSLTCISLCIYNFQIKEYRFDRLLAFIKEKGIWFLVLPERFYLPKKSVRNRNIVIISFALLLTHLFLVWSLVPNFVVRVVFYALSPASSVVFVIVGVLYTATIVKRKRADVVNEAVSKLANSKVIVIGVTGSFGKTSTKEFLYKILSLKFKVEKTDENQNTDIGIAMSINKNLKSDTQYFIVEMGAYKQGEINLICNMVHPTYGILTGLSNQHLGLFGSRENLILAKSELLKSLPKEGKAYVNADSLGYKEALKDLKCNVSLFSMQSNETDVSISNFSADQGLSCATVLYKSSSNANAGFAIKSKLLGRHTISNLLPCIALAYDLGVSKDQIESCIQNLQPINGRLSTHTGLKGATYLYDGYSSNVKGFLAALDVLENTILPKKFLVTKGVIELGNERVTSYKEILGELNKSKIELVTTDRLFKDLDSSGRVVSFRSEKDIIKYLKDTLDNKSTVLIEGRFSDNFISALELK